jgi:glycosyltransferase involved in cell wall biosynthesis
MRLSIIIPVYNAEKYLDNCLDSVFKQQLNPTNYEVIAINDGSKDNSLSILKEYQKVYSNLVVLTQENKGEAETRNRAIALAKGTYIGFVDSDDEIEPNTLKQILERAENDQLDILYLNMSLYDEKGNFIYDIPNVGNDNEIKSGFDHPNRTYCATLYLKETIGEVVYDKEIMIGLDTVFNAMVQTKAKRCSSISIPYYKYFQREDSTSDKGKTERGFNGFKNAIETLAQFQKTNFPNSNAVHKEYFDRVITVFITRILDHNVLPNLNKQRFRQLKNTLNALELNYLLDILTDKYRFINKSDWQFFSLQKILRLKHKLTLIVKKNKNK